jgi:pimeloyl-ACP methyl ester carboxylesterase
MVPDGSRWRDILQSHGYSVRVVQEPETSFAADVAATRRVLDKVGPCVLVGHSYGGMIITETGTHPDVKALVYVAAIDDIPAEVRRLERLGATVVDRPELWVIMQAPTGQRFCVVRVQRPGFPKNANRWD